MLFVHLVANSLPSTLVPRLSTSKGLRPLFPRLDDLSDRFLKALGDVPAGVVCFHLPEVAVVADMVADAVLVDVGVLLRLARESLGDLERLKDGAAVLLASA